jgi:hypothetical protein
MRINVAIDRIVLEGVQVDPHQVPALRRALEAELGRLLAGGSRQTLPPGGAVPVLRAGMPAAAPGDAAAWGAAIAGATHSAVLP